jgi:hypothetical protein
MSDMNQLWYREAVAKLVRMIRTGLLIGLCAACLMAQEYTKDGKMLLPPDYRQWTFVTSGLGMTYGGAGNSESNPSFDNVFASPAAYKAFLQTGTWPEKTVLILEIRGSDSKVSINQGGHVQTDVLAVEAHVKDARFPGGWAFFEFRKSDRADPTPTTAACYSCHQQNGAVDTTFVQFYPLLREVAAKKGTLKAGSH